MAPQPAAPQNTLGLVGFICSLVGIVGTCGLLSPIGAILSLVGMFRQPRGLAIAGFIIGLVGSIWILVFFVFIGFAAVAVALGLGMYAKVTKDFVTINTAIVQYEKAHGSLPSALQGLPGLTKEDLTDPWGNTYSYQADPAHHSYTIQSVGPDGKPGTGDEVRTTVSNP